MSEKFTKGPWEAVFVKEGHFNILPVVRTERRVPIAVVDHSRDGHEKTRIVTAKADAHLIAAALDMYEALKWCADVFSDDALHNMVFAALAKARGES